MSTKSKHRILLSLICQGVLFSVVFTVTVKFLSPLFGFTLTEDDSGNLHTVSSMLTGALCAYLYGKSTKELDEG